MLSEREEMFAQIELAMNKITEILEALDNEIQRLQRRVTALERNQVSIEEEIKAKEGE